MLLNFIINGVCKKDEKTICNIGYACDGCLYNNECKCGEFYDRDVKNPNYCKKCHKELPNLYKPITIKNKCYCCHQEKECVLIDSIKNGIVEQRFSCASCNHLKPSMDAEPDHIILGEK